MIDDTFPAPRYLPEIPPDEFANGQPLTFTQTENGYSLGSVGADGITVAEDDIRLEIEL